MRIQLQNKQSDAPCRYVYKLKCVLAFPLYNILFTSILTSTQKDFKLGQS